MTLQQLEYILAVNQFRHFAQAAEYCRVTQPTLSAMIQKLEEELDTKIFDRSQQPVCPTPIGLHIIEQARNVLVQTHRIKNIIEEEKHSLSGIFKLGILPTIAPYLLPRFFPQLMKKYPQLDIRVVEMKTNDIKKALQTGDIDAGIVAGLAGMEEFRQIPLFYEQFYTYIARENRLFSNEVIRTSDLTGEQLWLLDEGHCFRDQLVQTIGMILSGQALIINDDVWGNRNIITELSSGMLYGESYACISSVPAQISVIANENLTVMLFNINHIITTCSSSCSFHTRLIRNLLEIIARKNVRLMNKIDHISKKNLRDKILNYLSGESMHAGSNTFTIPYDRQGLADYLNADRSALSNELSKLQKEGVLSYKKNTFSLKY